MEQSRLEHATALDAASEDALASVGERVLQLEGRHREKEAKLTHESEALRRELAALQEECTALHGASSRAQAAVLKAVERSNQDPVSLLSPVAEVGKKVVGEEKQSEAAASLASAGFLVGEDQTSSSSLPASPATGAADSSSVLSSSSPEGNTKPKKKKAPLLILTLKCAVLEFIRSEDPRLRAPSVI
jgi:hypothetical protein